MRNLLHLAVIMLLVFWLGGCDQKPAIKPSGNLTGIVGKVTISPDGKAHRPLCIDSIQNHLSKFIVKVY